MPWESKPTAGQASPLQVPWGRAGALGIDVEPITRATKRLQAQVDAGRLPGFMSCVVKDSQLVHFQAYGLADLCAGTAMHADTLFRLYSQTKPVTVVGALRLMEQELLSLDDPIAKYIPGFAKVVVGEKRRQPSRQIFVRDLLAHTSGIGFGPGFGYEPESTYERTYADVVHRVDKGDIRSLADWCSEIAKLPLQFQPGKGWGYGYSSDILGRIIEVVSGRPLDKFLQAEVLEPLGMRDTFFAVPKDRAPRLAALYKREPWDGSGTRVKFVTADPGGSGRISDPEKRVHAASSDGTGTSAPSASVFLQGRASKVVQGGGCVCSVAGGLVSTMRDYLRFGQMLLNEGHVDGIRLLRPESVRILRKDWLNELSLERRKQPLWVWNTPGIGFSPLGQIGVEHPEAKNRRIVGSQLQTVHWGGAGGSGYMLNWPHRVLVLTYTGCTYDTATQKMMWRATFGALRRGGAKPLQLPAGICAIAQPVAQTPGTKRPRRRTFDEARDEEACSPGHVVTSTPTKRRRPSASTDRKVVRAL